MITNTIEDLPCARNLLLIMDVVAGGLHLTNGAFFRNNVVFANVLLGLDIGRRKVICPQELFCKLLCFIGVCFLFQLTFLAHS